MTNPIKQTYSDKWKYIQITKQLHYFLLLLSSTFIYFIPPNILLKTFLSKLAAIQQNLYSQSKTLLCILPLVLSHRLFFLLWVLLDSYKRKKCVICCKCICNPFFISGINSFLFVRTVWKYVSSLIIAKLYVPIFTYSFSLSGFCDTIINFAFFHLFLLPSDLFVLPVM